MSPSTQNNQKNEANVQKAADNFTMRGPSSKTPIDIINIYPGLKSARKRPDSSPNGEKTAARPVAGAKRRHENADGESHQAEKKAKVQHQQPVTPGSTPKSVSVPSSRKGKPPQRSLISTGNKGNQIQGQTGDRLPLTPKSVTRPKKADPSIPDFENGSSEGESDFNEGAFFQRFHPGARRVLVSNKTDTTLSKDNPSKAQAKVKAKQPEVYEPSRPKSSKPTRKADRSQIKASGTSKPSKPARGPVESTPGGSSQIAGQRAGSKRKAGRNENAPATGPQKKAKIEDKSEAPPARTRASEPKKAMTSNEGRKRKRAEEEDNVQSNKVAKKAKAQPPHPNALGQAMLNSIEAGNTKSSQAKRVVRTKARPPKPGSEDGPSSNTVPPKPDDKGLTNDSTNGIQKKASLPKWEPSSLSQAMLNATSAKKSQKPRSAPSKETPSRNETQHNTASPTSNGRNKGTTQAINPPASARAKAEEDIRSRVFASYAGRSTMTRNTTRPPPGSQRKPLVGKTFSTAKAHQKASPTIQTPGANGVSQSKPGQGASRLAQVSGNKDSTKAVDAGEHSDSDRACNRAREQRVRAAQSLDDPSIRHSLFDLEDEDFSAIVSRRCDCQKRATPTSKAFFDFRYLQRTGATSCRSHNGTMAK
ncbi:MAG: hypothetical protein M1831_001551 [Alyxoria varia]|nr:MAG: hypothetical protein M1831_001551 [Alyxoria varia]